MAMKKSEYSAIKAQLRLGIKRTEMANNLKMKYEDFLMLVDKVESAEKFVLAELALDNVRAKYSPDKVEKYIDQEHASGLIAEEYKLSIRTAQRWIQKYKSSNKYLEI